MLAPLVAVAAVVALAQPGAERLSAEQVAGDLRAFQNAAQENWSYFSMRTSLDGLDLAGAVREAAERMKDGATREEFARELRLLVAGLHDGHAHVFVPGVQAAKGRRLPWSVRECAEGVIITDAPEAPGDGDAPRRGDRVVSIGGVAVEDRIRTELPSAIGSTPGMRRIAAIEGALHIRGEGVEIELEAPEGERRRWTFPLPQSGVLGAAPGSARGTGVDWPAEGIARLTIPAFTVDDWEGWRRAAIEERERFLESSKARLDAAVDEIIAGGARAAIIDLRGNTGGTDLLGIHLAQRFLAAPFRYFLLSAKHDGVWTVPGGITYEPRPERFAGPLVVLADEHVFSTADNFLRCLQDLHPDLTVIGRPTGAGTGAPTPQPPLPHSGAVVTYCVQRVYGPKGRLIEGTGTLPDIPVVWTRGDVLEGRDPDLEAALERLKGVAPPSASPAGSPVRPAPEGKGQTPRR